MLVETETPFVEVWIEIGPYFIGIKTNKTISDLIGTK